MGPRLFGIPATASPVVAVIRRGPSGWSHVGRWDPDAGTYEPGAWLRGVIYPQRCDLSPDGRWLTAFILKGNARWEPGATYITVSRLPWLTALAAWGTGGTWTRGLRFVDRGAAEYPPDPPDTGDIAPLLRRYALDHRRAASFAVERTRGWTETADSPPRRDDDPWDERRAPFLTLQKPRPADPGHAGSPRGPGERLLVRGWYAAFRGGPPGTGPARYALAMGSGAEQPLGGVQWADWTADGRLLVATTAGELQVRPDPRSTEPSWRLECATLGPSPEPPPPEAHAW